jgi:thiol-disulfide isomerase/thioredoxin
MKKISILFNFLLCLFLTTNAQIYFKPDLKNQTEWETFTLYDLDNRKPYYQDWGTESPYKAWIRAQYDDNTVLAVSTSYYNPVGQANDWLVTPAITIPEGATNAILAWDAIAYDTNYRDGYQVYISTTGNTVADFGNTPVFSINQEEAGGLKNRSIPLSNYAGQTIYIAWVNNSNDMFILGIGNITVGLYDFSFTPDIPDYVSEEEVTIKGVFKNLLNPIQTFTAHYVVNGTTYSQTFENVNIATGASYNFEFTQKLSLNVASRVSWEMWVSTDELTKEKQTGIVARVSEIYPRKVVGEEGTGTWCGWCPRGAVYMKYMKEKYPETFIGIAVHNGDPMVVTEYDTGMSSLISGYPSGVINRIVEADPSDFEAVYNQEINRITPAKVNLSAQFTNETKTEITANIQSEFAVNYKDVANFKIAIVVTENGVKGTASGYRQVNYYAGGTNGAMGGYENLPNPVPASQMVYQDVARALFGSFTGFNESIPSTISVGTPIDYTYTFILPSSVLNVDSIEVVALLFDGNTGEIVNADRIAASEIKTYTSIKEIQLTGLIVNAYKNTEETLAIDVETKDAQVVSIAIYGLDGKLVKSIDPVTVENTHQFIVPTNGLKGSCLVKVNAGRQIRTKKIVL